MNSEPTQSWISVKDRLPEKDVPVLVCEDGVVETVAVFTEATVCYHPLRKVMQWEVLANCIGYEFEENPCRPDYWMPLPEPPNTTHAHPPANP